MRQRRARRRQVKRPRRRARPPRAAPPAPPRAPAPAAPPASPFPARRRTAGRRRSGGCPSRNRADSTRRAATARARSARPVTPNVAACSTISGNSVTTSIRMLRRRAVTGLLVVRAPSRRRSAACDVDPRRRYAGTNGISRSGPAPRRSRDAQHRMRAVLPRSRARRPARRPSRFTTARPDEVGPVDLAVAAAGSAVRGTPTSDPCSASAASRVATPPSAATSEPECIRASSRDNAVHAAPSARLQPPRRRCRAACRATRRTAGP